LDNRKLELYFFFALFIGILLVSGFILEPFIYAIILAAVFSIVFRGLYRKFSAIFRSKSVGAIATVVIVLGTVLIPLTFFGRQVFNEIQQLYSYLIANGGKSLFVQSFENIVNSIQGYFAIGDREPIQFSIDFNIYIRSALNWLLGNFGSIFSSFALVGVNLFLFLFAFYYLLKDGVELKNRIVSLSPLTDKYDEEISKKLELAINSVIKGTLVVSLIQGFMTGLGLWIFGVPNPAFWGSIAAVSSLVPGIGTALISGPSIVYLFLSGNTLPAIGLIIWAVMGVGLVDNLLYPKLVQRQVKIHSFLILLFVLGGFAFFGPMGFIMGPITLSLLFALLDVYSFLIRKHEHKDSEI